MALRSGAAGGVPGGSQADRLAELHYQILDQQTQQQQSQTRAQQLQQNTSTNTQKKRGM